LRPVALGAAALLGVALFACQPTADNRPPAERTAQARQNRVTQGFPTPTSAPLPTSTATPSCQGAVWWYDARSRVGERLTIQGEVLELRPGSRGGQTTSELSLGQRFPDPNRFVLSVPGQVAQTTVGRAVCATGRVVSHDGVHALELDSASALTFAR
jgi:hypothetical protein